MTSRILKTLLWPVLGATVLLAGCGTTAADAGPTREASSSPTPPSATPPATSAAPSASEADEQAILLAGRERTQAMIDGNIDRLGELLAAGFTAVHINGYEQPKAEWLEQIASGEMAYHDVEEVSAVVDIDGDTAVLTTRNLVTATIYGSSGTWPLESVATYEKRDGTWVTTTSRSTTY